MSSTRLFPAEKKSPMKTGTLTLGNISKQIPQAKLPKGGGYFLYFKLNDHADLVEEGARLIAERIKLLGLQNPYFVTPEASTIAMAHVLKTKYNIDGKVIYKATQIDDVDPVIEQYDTVTATDKKQLVLCREKAEAMKGKDIFILDSVCTTGGTIRGTYNLLMKAGIPADKIVEATMLFTEGAERHSLEISAGKEISLHSFGHLPLIKEAAPSHSFKA